MFLDARVETLRLEDQRRFVTTIVPSEDLDASGPIEGYAMFSAPLATE
jgi:hypothetical protein